MTNDQLRAMQEEWLKTNKPTVVTSGTVSSVSIPSTGASKLKALRSPYQNRARYIVLPEDDALRDVTGSSEISYYSSQDR